MFVLWDDTGFVVKRVVRLSEDGLLRSLSANPECPPYDCLAEDAHVVGKVVWRFTRA